MRAALCALALVLASPGFAQSKVVIEKPVLLTPIVIQLDGIPTSALVTMLLRDVMRVPYVISPDVLSDRRATSVRLIIPRDQVPERVVGYLRRSGFIVQLSGGTVYVSKSGTSRISGGTPTDPLGYAPGTAVPQGSPLDPGPARPRQVESEIPQDPPAQLGRQDTSSGQLTAEMVLAYRPAHRSPSYLASVIAPLFPGIVSGARPEAAPDQASGTVAPETGPDTLVLAGSVADLGKAKRLIETLDRARPMVAVKAVVLSVQDIKTRGSALSLFGKLLGGNVELGLGGTIASGSQFVRIGKGALTAALSVVREDSRFKVVATPNLAALSGAVATMNSGSQVPTVGSVVFPDGGAPVQSVVYRDSGITLTIKPTVRAALIELDVKEERSTFVRTTTGVEDSPTLQKSSASASVILKDGESVVLAGLTEEASGNTKEGLLGGLLGVRSRDKSSAELLVVIQAEIVPTPLAPGGEFIVIHGPDESAPLPVDVPPALERPKRVRDDARPPRLNVSGVQKVDHARQLLEEGLAGVAASSGLTPGLRQGNDSSALDLRPGVERLAASSAAKAARAATDEAVALVAALGALDRVGHCKLLVGHCRNPM